MTFTPPDRFAGLLLGTAVGDALGLPAEGLRPATIRRLGWNGNWHHRFVAGRGMWSDDTEHTIMTAQALLRSGGDVHRFTRSFAWELRWWILGLPAGVGLATARAILKLWLGAPPSRSAVFSAGNGPCMRAAIVGAFHASDRKLRDLFTEAHTRITHRDPKAVTASLAVADLAELLSRSHQPPGLDGILDTLRRRESDPEWVRIIHAMEECIRNGSPLAEFQQRIGSDPERGVSGYAYHTVPVVLFLGITHDWDFRATLSRVLDAGGDADSTGAIAGALCGVFGGREAVPKEWLSGIAEWPTTTRGLGSMAEALSSGQPIRIRPRWSPALLARNLFFLAVVLVHGFLRFVPAGLRRSRAPIHATVFP
jgi:ADP-ribosylglycohydrolase